MALQTSSLAEACSPFQIKDERGLAEMVDEFREENPRMLEDLELVSREIRDFMQARGAECRGTVERSIDYEDENLRRILFRVHINEKTPEEEVDALGDLVTHLAGKRPGFLRHIMIDIF